MSCPAVGVVTGCRPAMQTAGLVEDLLSGFAVMAGISFYQDPTIIKCLHSLKGLKSFLKFFCLQKSFLLWITSLKPGFSPHTMFWFLFQLQTLKFVNTSKRVSSLLDICFYKVCYTILFFVFMPVFHVKIGHERVIEVEEEREEGQNCLRNMKVCK